MAIQVNESQAQFDCAVKDGNKLRNIAKPQHMMVCNMIENSYIEIIQTWSRGAIVMLIQSSQDFYFSQAFKHWGYSN